MARSSGASADARPFPERAAWLAAGGLLLLAPFVWSGASADPFRSTQGTVALVLVAILGACFVVRADGAAWRDPWMLPWFAVVLAALVSAPASGEPARILFNVAFVILAALAWGALRQFDAARRRRLAALVVVSGTVEALATVAFLFPALRPETLSFIATAPSRERWIGTLGNPGDIAVFLVLPALVAAELASSSTRRRWLVAAAAIMVGVALGTRTISALAALVAGFVVLLWKRASGRARLAGFAAMAGLLIIVVLATPLGYRLRTLPSAIAEGGWMWLGSGRGAGFAASAAMVASHPVTGIGFGLFGAHSFAYQSESVLAARAQSLGLVTGFADAHNDLLQYTAETGLVGLLLLVGGVVLAVKRRSREGGAALPWPSLVAAAGVIAMAQFPLHIDVIAAQWLIVSALIAPSLRHRAAPQGVARKALAGVVVAAVLASGYVGWQHHKALVMLEQGRNLVTALQQRPPEPRVADEISRRARANLERCREWLPYSYDLDVTLGSIAMAGRDYAEALTRFRHALGLAERPEIRFDVGMALIASGQHDQGLEELVRAVTLNPRVLRQLSDTSLRDALRARLDASGYSARYPWIWNDKREPGDR